MGRGHHAVGHIVIAGLLFISVPEEYFFSFILFDRVLVIIVYLNLFNLIMKLFPFLAGFALLKQDCARRIMGFLLQVVGRRGTLTLLVILIGVSSCRIIIISGSVIVPFRADRG